jgi:hypothetical protein
LRLKCSKHIAFGVGNLPDMTGVRMLLSLLACLKFTVAAPPTACVEPEQFDLGGCSINERYCGHGPRSGAPAGHICHRNRRKPTCCSGFFTFELPQVVSLEIASPIIAAYAKHQSIIIELEVQVFDRQTLGADILQAGIAKRLREAFMIESPLTNSS